MVAKRPEDRPQSITQVIAELERCLSGGSPTVVFERSADSTTSGLSTGSGNELQQFLQQISGEASTSATSAAPAGSKGTVVTPSSAEAETMISSAGEGGTDPLTAQSLTIERSGSPSGKKKKPLLLGSLAAAVVVLLAIVFAVRGKSATLHLEIADELIEVTLGDTGRTVQGAKEHTLRVPIGELVLHIKRDDLEFDTDPFEVTKGENVPIKVERVGRAVRAMQGKTLLGRKEGPKSQSDTAAVTNAQTLSLVWRPTAQQKAFFDEVAKLPAEEQIKRVTQKMRDVNPGFNPTSFTTRIEGGKVVHVGSAQGNLGNVTELWPLRTCR